MDFGPHAGLAAGGVGREMMAGGQKPYLLAMGRAFVANSHGIEDLYHWCPNCVPMSNSKRDSMQRGLDIVFVVETDGLNQHGSTPNSNRLIQIHIQEEMKTPSHIPQLAAVQVAKVQMLKRFVLQCLVDGIQVSSFSWYCDSDMRPLPKKFRKGISNTSCL